MCSVILGQLESFRNFKGFMHQAIPAAPSPFPGATAGQLPALSVLGVGHLPTHAGASPELLTRTRFPIRI